MSENWVHEYFDRKSSEWNIISFFGEYDAESLNDKIGYYLNDRYKQKSSIIILLIKNINKELVAPVRSSL
jgi:hypothetical protein